MGNFYVNFTVKSDDSRRIAGLLERGGRKAFVTPAINGYVVVCEEDSDSQDTRVIEALGAQLARDRNGPVLAVLNHDDDILCYWLFQEGRLTDSYNSCPDYFGDDETEESESGGDSQRLCAIFSVPDQASRVETVLRSDDYAFAFERRADLVEALGLPAAAVCLGYGYVINGDFPEDLDEGSLISTG